MLAGNGYHYTLGCCQIPAHSMKLKQFPRHLANFLIVLAFLAHASGNWRIPFVEDLEYIAYDARLNLTLENRVDPRIVILDIDEKSLAQEGRWPWPRERLAYMIDLLFDYYGIGLLAFDVVFSERDESSGLPLLQLLAEGPLANNEQFIEQFFIMAPELDYDAVFARSLQGRNVVLGYFGTDDLIDGKPIRTGKLPEPALVLDERAQRIPFVSTAGYGANLEVLQNTVPAGGYFHNPLVDRDGKFRRFPLLMRDGDKAYVSLATQIVRSVLGNPPVKLEIAEGYAEGDVEYGLEAIDIGGIRVPVDYRGAVLVPYLGKQGSFKYVSLTEVLNAQVDPKVLENAVVIIGTTAAGLLDLRSTPVQNVYPGVEIQANIASGILDQRIKHRPAYIQGIEFVAILLVGLVFSLLVPTLAPVFAVLLTIVTFSGVLYGSFYTWNEFNLATEYAMLLVMVGFLILSNLFFSFFLEQRDKRKLSGVFGHYVPPELVEEMSENPESFGLEGESREMSVLFSDVRGFTTISEGLEPTELTRVINEILTPMTGVIHANRGTIDKYMGDAIMAFWGAPVHDEEHAAHAVRAGLDILKVTELLREGFVSKGWPPIQVGVGVNTGTMSVGNMGSEFRMAYTVMGDAVNLGSRLEGLTKQYGVNFIVSESTARAASNFTYRELDCVRVKGKDEPVIILEPLGITAELDEASMEELEIYHEAIVRYREQDWLHAHNVFRKLRKAHPDEMIYEIYIERIEHFRENPPDDDWDGVYTHTSK